jgi:prevent-host-death family protein
MIMKTLEVAKATAPLAEYAQHVDKEPVVLTVSGRPVAALISVGTMDWETVTLSLDPQFLALVERSRARQQAHGGISSTEMRRRLGLKKAKRGK